MVCEYLARYAGLLANHLCYGFRNSIGRVFLVCTLFDDNAAVHVDAALRIVFLRMRRMERMCIIGRNHKASRKISVVSDRIFSARCVDVLQGLSQERRICALFGKASDFLVVKDCADINLTCRFCGKESF